MMKQRNAAILLSAITLGIWGCNGQDRSTTAESNKETVAATTMSASFIHKDSANRMIGSYLESVGYPELDDSIRSWSVDAEALKQLLENETIVDVKITIGHTLTYVNAGHYGVASGMSDALTLLISGVDASGNTVFHDLSKVINRLNPCPPQCAGGTAGNATF